MTHSSLVKTAAKIIANAEYLVALTGAGISKESNIPTFRGNDGLWKNYDPMKLATPEAFANNPTLVWEWYSWRQNLIASCSPNPGHIVLEKWEKRDLLKALVTQNVDGLHRRAGSKAVYEIHGNIWAVKCTVCAYKGSVSEPVQGVPRCPNCDGLLRPDVVWFGEPLDMDVINAVYKEFQRCDVCIVIGTSAVVYPAASFPLIVKNNNGLLIEINVEQTPLTESVDIHLRGKAGEILPKIDEQILNRSVSDSSKTAN